MDYSKFFHIKNTSKNISEATISLLKAIDQKGWSIFQIYDMQERLKAKGFDHPSIKIIEICSAKFANALLKKNILVSLCLPCRIVLFQEDGTIKIGVLNPQVISTFMTDITKNDTEEVEKSLKEIIELAA